MKRPVFVVGTGRCGSTMLSNMLAECNDALMLSEFFVSLSPGAFPKQALDGASFWELLTTPRLKYSTLIEHRIAPPELLYAHSRIKSWSGRVPPILLVTLPFLSGEPEELYSWLEGVVTLWPEQSVGRQYQQLFALLGNRLGRSVVVERSGGSLRFVSSLYESFPDALFVHLYRNGPDCARSMSRHASFRLAAMIEGARPLFGGDPFHVQSRPETPLPKEIRAILPESFDPQFVMQAEIGEEEFGRLWSAQVATGLSALKRVPEDQVYPLRYEDLLDHPREALEALAEEIGLDSGDWIERAAAIPVSRPQEKSAIPVTAQLQSSCAIGMRLLGYPQ